MSQAETLLASLTEDVIIHEHPVTDPDGYFLIDPDSRVITTVSAVQNTLMQYDHESERYTFEVSRVVEGHDMMKCNRVRVHYNNIDSKTKREFASVDELTDLAVSLEDPSTVTCSWLIPRDATQYAGILSFLIQFMCVADDGTIVYEWHTDIYSDVEVKPGRRNGEQVVSPYNDLLEDWYQRLFGSKDSVMASIITESDEIKNEIERKGEDTLESIPDDYSELYNTSRNALRTRANAIVPTVFGDTIVISDSSDDHLRNLRIFGKTPQHVTTGKNLFNADRVARGSHIVVNGNTITVTPLPTGQAVDSECPLSEVLKANAGDTVIISGKTTGINRLYIIDTATSWLWGTPLTLTAEMLASNFYLYGGSTNGAYATITDLQVEFGEVATEYEPYTDGLPSPSPSCPQSLSGVGDEGSIDVNLYGKNLLEITSESKTEKGITFTVSANGGVTVSGTATATVYYVLKSNISFTRNRRYTLTGCPAGGSLTTYLLYAHNNTSGVDYYDIGKGTTFIPPDGSYNVVIAVYKGTTINSVFYPMISIGEVVSAYEPYRPIQTISIQTPNGLRGIPVESDGNYTDSSGQQWVCDEINFERGVYIQRIQAINVTEFKGFGTRDNGVTYGIMYPVGIKPFTMVLSNSYVGAMWSTSDLGMYNTSTAIVINDNRFTSLEVANSIVASEKPEVYYILATPVETPLTEDELIQFKMAHTNFPNTTVFNDVGACMEVGYNADTETYLEQLPKATDEQVDSSVEKYLIEHSAEIDARLGDINAILATLSDGGVS